jgi:hypothetical protein
VILARIGLILASLVATFALSAAAPADSPAAPPAAAASIDVIACGGSIGQPLWKNVGDRNPNTIGVSFTNYNYIYQGYPEYYCPNYIYVHSGRDIYVFCYSGGSLIGSRTFTSYGWNSIPDWMRSASECRMNEYWQ